MSRRLLLFFLMTCTSYAALLQRPQAVKNPHGSIKQDCQQCHSTNSWAVDAQEMDFDHASTGFALVGAHSAQKCASCHESLTFSNIGSSCADCHTDIHRGELGKECESCHNAVSWENRQEIFMQHLNTRFPLKGAHALTDCESCHFNQQRNTYKNTPVECQFCHTEDYIVTEHPNHREAGFPMDCQACHRINAFTWADTDFDHSTFPLTGAHQRTACESCHSEHFAGTPRDCYACHKSDYDATAEPQHAPFGFQTDCQTCHDTERWTDTTFDHVGVSGFELVDIHATLLCSQCHVNNQVTGLARDCFGCHETDYRGATDPNHVAANYPHDCTTCHTQTAWQPATFDHNLTAFPLTGVHQTVQCTDCHINNVYSGTPTNCYACHETDFRGADEPDHEANNFDHDCAICHSTTAWQPATFDHNTTAFPLTGAHTNALCADCHAAGYAGTPTACYACHESDFRSADDPDHQANNFDHNCAICHTTAAWKPATFDHNNTAFPLTGAHTSTPCANCHISGYAGTPMDCYFCHQDDYDATTDPNHKAAQFPLECQTCHSTTAWDQASYNHDDQYFPIYSGEHRGEWSTCADCHVNSSNYAVFECINCHEHSKSRTDNEHDEVRNYQYVSTACYSCHPRGRE